VSERQRAMVATELANMTLGSNQWESKSGHPAPVTQPEACAAAVPGTAAMPIGTVPPPCPSKAPSRAHRPRLAPWTHRKRCEFEKRVDTQYPANGWHLGHTASAARLAGRHARATGTRKKRHRWSRAN